MSDADIFAQRINDYVAQFGTESIKDVDGVLALANFADKKGSILPTDFCYNRYNNGLGDFSGPHLFEYTDDKQFMGIEEDRYPHLKEMSIKPLRYSRIGNKKVDTAVFYSATKSSLDYLSMDCFWARVRTGELVLKEAEAAKWLTIDDIDSVKWLPADLILIEDIKKTKA